MQTEEVVPRTQSIGIDSSLTDGAGLQHHLHHSVHLRCPLSPLIHMAVKQEPQEEEERSRDTSTLSPQVDVGNVAGSMDSKHGQQGGNQIQALEENLALTSPDSTSRGRTSRGRRKSRWKLKFHHQALPPEYLDHYEASLAQENLNLSPPRIIEPTASSPAPTNSTSTPSPVADVHGWLQRIAAMQQELCPQIAPPQCPTTLGHNQVSAGTRRSVITSVSSQTCNTTYPSHHIQQTQTSSRPPMKYSDLPYMGEITLDNSKPRRGRKPKKADICHLIYKNYGTILPGTPGHEEKRLSPRDKQERVSPQVPFQRTDVQNRISSLLEKRLTQETRRNFVLSENSREQDEPLNLCIRDLNQLKIRLLRKHGNVYESGQVKSETSSDGEEVECLGTSFLSEPVNYPESVGHRSNNSFVNHNNNVIDPMIGHNSGFVYWPNAGVFIHPMALQSQLLYYQKVAQNDKGLPTSTTDQPPREQKIMPKSIYSMMEMKNATQASTLPISQTIPVSVATSTSPRPKRNAPLNQQQSQPTKRKRSAIFIPPMPTENNNNPATEVSICKFKFTGGAKPSLQEKKSLSVDSGGNFRYYSGTGDKSMRGYEFFPREALQQPAGQSGTTSAAGAFLNAAGERIQPPTVCQRSPTGQDDGRRKRKTRKSLQREKLEQTFKEKGFLIQTQQLESAEGATYCKFRQLRKFTRYLFRSWKDYLPGNVRELSGCGTGAAVAIENDVADVEVDGDTTLVPSPLPRGNLLDVPNSFVEDHRTLPLT
ncbi:PREDICTED: uncharacterized protein LOC108769993 isoform X2 [Trachymyrmex cornetzi]|nr:PREDICTED: uncharacterized protein LOC108769993 isoform X2 [Trachymyrmex cornetzi]XP_018376769.1 PREDICTED: uncharacterized protein LOC108769993 isoform X2 [Trachymyrmex cornetzi]XP_018376770.1 PREDICTED: uncharacterized protein LOC108769993 isoform X2 [Trachymyrmex cornetzi]XP_018376772.1 PREDICTED: uncharacterized protein LOC108769993 isoform X2 [Trachymyrmex cornetzi]